MAPTEFTKKSAQPDAQFAWEAAGLRWLAEADGVRIVRVLDVTDRSITEERVHSHAASRQAAEQFGRHLQRTHVAGAEHFGTPPPGWSGDGWIGMTRLPIREFDSWGRFFAETRVMPFARAARDRNSLSASDMGTIEKVCEHLITGDFDDSTPPARLHGDLWSGNVLWTDAGVVLIDSAAHGGHPETDLAMLALFGLPHLHTVFEAYAEVAGLDSDWQTRIRLHQLHPLLVHAQLFGGSYGSQAGAAARRYT